MKKPKTTNKTRVARLELPPANGILDILVVIQIMANYCNILASHIEELENRTPKQPN